MEKIVLSPEDSAKFKQQLLDEGIKPHFRAIAEMAVNSPDAIAIVIHDLDPAAVPVALEMGWDGTAAGRCYQMPEDVRERLIRGLRRMGDEVSVRWLRRRGGAMRLYLMSGIGTLLINHAPGLGFSIEPGSLDDVWHN